MEQNNGGCYADLARFMTANAPEHPVQEPKKKKKPATPEEIRREKRRVIKRMRRVVETINGVEAVDRLDAGDLTAWLQAIKDQLKQSIDKLEALK